MELAEKLRRAQKAKQFSPEHEAELQARKPQERARVVQPLVDAIIELGYLPIQSKNSTVLEKHLAVRLSRTYRLELCDLSLSQGLPLGCGGAP